jgi:hypothetical protein
MHTAAAMPSAFERTRVTAERRSSTAGDPKAWIASVFGLPFFGVGVLLTLVGVGVIESDPDSFNGPRWIVTAVGGFFGLCGLFVITAGFYGLINHWRVQRVQRLRPDEPWMADYPWDETRTIDRPGRNALNTLIAGLIVGGFVGPFNALVFDGDGPILGMLAVAFFDIVAAGLIGQAAYLFARTMKYGRSYVRFKRLPYRVGETFEADWVAPRGLGRYDKLTFTLRCVEQVAIETSDDDHTYTAISSYAIWSDSFTLDGPRQHLRGEAIPVSFSIPSTAKSTHFLTIQLRFWELVVHADTPGVDFEATYLVPVYAAA